MLIILIDDTNYISILFASLVYICILASHLYYLLILLKTTTRPLMFPCKIFINPNIGAAIDPTTLPNNSCFEGKLANTKISSLPINLFSKIPHKILKVSWSFENLFAILAGATSSSTRSPFAKGEESIPKTNASCPGTFSFILFQKENVPGQLALVLG